MTSNVIISHVAMLDDLTTLIRLNPDPRELKRAIAVQMWNKGHKHQDIQDSLSVSSGFISKWTQRYEREGILSLKLAHRASTGYLDPEQRSKVIQPSSAHLNDFEISDAVIHYPQLESSPLILHAPPWLSDDCKHKTKLEYCSSAKR